MFKPAGVVNQGLGDILGEDSRPFDKSKTGRLFELSWKGQAREGDSPVKENLQACCKMRPSTTVHEKFCGNLPGPPGKAKYSYMTDSELVPRGKSEKYS